MIKHDIQMKLLNAAKEIAELYCKDVQRPEVLVSAIASKLYGAYAEGLVDGHNQA